MKKEDFTGLIVYVAILVLAIVFGLTVLQTHSKESFINVNYGSLAYGAFMFGAISAGVILNAILYEVAHLLGAKVGGYNVDKIIILGFCFFKENGKTRFKFSSFDGLTGETKIFPKENHLDKKGNPKEPSPYAFLWFGSLFIVIEVLIVMVLFTALKVEPKSLLCDFAFFILTVGMIGFMILLYNIIPFKLDSPTDGYRMTLVSNPKNKEAFNELLRVEKAVEEGREYEIKTFTEITNFTADLNLNKVYQLLDKREFEEAEILIDGIINAKNSVSSSVFIRARAQKIYIDLMGKDLESATEYYNNEISLEEKRSISNDISMPSIRVYLLITGLIEKSKSEALIAINNVPKALKRTPKSRKQIEAILFNETLQKVTEAHPKWGFEDYQLTIKQ